MIKKIIGWLLLVGLALGMFNFYAEKFDAMRPATGSATESATTQTKSSDKTFLERAQNKFMANVNQMAIKDALESLQLVVRNGGSPAEVCVRAGILTAAIVQAREEALYREWRPTEEKICAKALGLH